MKTCGNWLEHNGKMMGKWWEHDETMMGTWLEHDGKMMGNDGRKRKLWELMGTWWDSGFEHDLDMDKKQIWLQRKSGCKSVIQWPHRDLAKGSPVKSILWQTRYLYIDDLLKMGLRITIAMFVHSSKSLFLGSLNRVYIYMGIVWLRALCSVWELVIEFIEVVHGCKKLCMFHTPP